ncbi:hypothetical protein ACFL27_00935 [candidate division CSSED10-310 bacterium]|uniref:Alpha-2-macroglobulin domain-containing protein n=1 Tax=candidate division CSSED10-310 bacterium TaxID=2855610 RepID=A0ABV6YRL7_UNCC1
MEIVQCPQNMNNRHSCPDSKLWSLPTFVAGLRFRWGRRILLLIVLLGLFPDQVLAAGRDTQRPSILSIHSIQATITGLAADKLEVEVPFTKPHLLALYGWLRVAFKKPTGEVIVFQDQRFFQWRDQGLRKMQFALPAFGAGWEDSLIQVRLRFSSQYDYATDWFPLRAILHRIQLRLLTSSTWFIGYPQSVRVIAVSGRSGKPCTRGTVTGLLENTTSKDRIPLFQVPLDQSGSCSPEIPVSHYSPGLYRLIIRVSTGTTTAQIEKDVTLAFQSNLTLRAPTRQVLQGVEVPVRASLHTLPTGQALAGRQITFQLFNPQRQLLDEQHITTEKTGEAFFHFAVPTQTETGLYLISAHSETIEKRLMIEVMAPRNFDDVLTITTNKKIYSLDDQIAFQVNFFSSLKGTPHPREQLVIRLTKPHRLARVFDTVWAKTDRNGSCRGKFKLQKIFAYRPLDQIPYLVKVTAHSKREREGKKASAECLIALFPDQYHLSIKPLVPSICPHVANTFILEARKLDGQPVAGQAVIRETGRDEEITLAIPDSGRVEFDLIPEKSLLSMTVQLDVAGSPRRQFTFGEQTSPTLLIKPDRSRKRETEAAFFEIITPEPEGHIYVDLINHNQVLHTFNLTVDQGHTALTVPYDFISRDTSSPYLLSAYQFPRSLTEERTLLRDLLQVPAANTRQIKWTFSLDKDSYNDWEKPEITIESDSAADTAIEAVWIDFFGLNLPPGMQGLKDNIFTTQAPASAFPVFNPGQAPLLKIPPHLNPETGFVLSGEEPLAMWHHIYLTKINDKAGEIWRKLPISPKSGPPLTTELVLQQGLLTADEIRDPWGSLYVINLPGQPITSNGEDCQPQTGDELQAPGGWFLVHTIPARDKVMAGRAGLAVTVFDYRSLPVQNSTVTVLNKQGSSSILSAGPHVSSFFDADLQPGSYSLAVSGFPFETLPIPNLKLQPDHLTYVRVALAKPQDDDEVTVAEEQPIHQSPALSSQSAADQEIKLTQYLFSRRFSRPQWQGNSLPLPLPEEWPQLFIKVTPITAQGFLREQWGKLEVMSDHTFQLTNPVAANTGEATETEISITNRTRKKMTVTIHLKKDQWYKKVRQTASRFVLSGGKSKTITLSLKPLLPGNHELIYELKVLNKEYTRKQHWAVTGGQAREIQCQWKMISADQTHSSSFPSFMVPLKSTPGTGTAIRGDKARTPVQLAVVAYTSPVQFLKDMEGIMPSYQDQHPDKYGLKIALIHLQLNVASYKLQQRLLKSGTVKNDPDPELKKKMQTWYQRILSFQVSGGGLAYKIGGKPDPELTAETMAVFFTVSKFIPIDWQNFLENRYWLLTQQSKIGQWSPADRANARIVRNLATMRTGLENIRRSLTHYQGSVSAQSDPVLIAYLAQAENLLGDEPQNFKKFLNAASRNTFTADSPGQTIIQALSLTSAAPFLPPDTSYMVLVDALPHLMQQQDIFTARDTIEALTEYLAQQMFHQPKGSLSIDIGEQSPSLLTIEPQLKGKEEYYLPFTGSRKLPLEQPVRITFQGEGSLIYQLCLNRY